MASRPTNNLWFHLKHTPCPSASHIGEVELARRGWDDFERPGGGGTRQIGVDVCSRGEVIGGEHDLLVAQFDVAEIPPAPAALVVVGDGLRFGHSRIGLDGGVDGFEAGGQGIRHHDVMHRRRDDHRQAHAHQLPALDLRDGSLVVVHGEVLP